MAVPADMIGKDPVRHVITAGQTTWWLNAVLAHVVPPDDGMAHLTGSIAFRAGEPVPWPLALGALRRTGTLRLSLRVVEPGDALGLPGPAEVTRLAVAVGLALVSADGTVTIVPVADTDRWRALASTGQPPSATPLGTVAEARTLMRTAMAEVTRSFRSLDPDDLALADLGPLRTFPEPIPPPGVDPRAAALAADALRVWWLTRIATDLSERRGEPIPDAIRTLRPLARRAVCVAFSEPVG